MRSPASIIHKSITIYGRSVRCRRKIFYETVSKNDISTKCAAKKNLTPLQLHCQYILAHMYIIITDKTVLK